MTAPYARRLWTVVLAAFVLRAAVAAADHARPLLPAYNYTDAGIYHESALNYLRSRSDPTTVFSVSYGKEAYTLWTASLYRIFGETELAPRLFNAAFASLSIFAWSAIAAALFSESTALACAVALLLWPSHAFYSGQHLKEAANMALLPMALMFGLKHLDASRQDSPDRRARELTFGALSLASLGFVRSFFLPAIGASFLAGAASAIKRPRARTLAVLLSVAGGIALYRAANAAADRFLRPASVAAPAAPGAPASRESLFSPRRISALRDERQSSSRDWAAKNADRRIETQIFPGARFDSWLSVAAFAPKASFYSLFMPLPGLYPIEGKFSRAAAAGENLVLLAVFLIALAGFAEGPFTPAKTTLFVLFFAAAVPSSVLEFDLGSAARHKLHYFPLILPFAMNAVLKRLPDRWQKASV